MKFLKRVILGLLLVAAFSHGAQAAIAFVASSVGPDNNSTSSGSLSLPTGFNTAGNVTVAVFVYPTTTTDSSAQPTITPPSGWNVLTSSCGQLVVWRAWQSGDASSISASSTQSGWWESVADTYSGADSTNFVDNFASFCHYSNASFSIYRAPQVNPNYNNSMLLIGFTNNSSSGGTSWTSAPAGFTARGNTSPGPDVWTGEKALTNGTATGDQLITQQANTNHHGGFQLAIRVSSASAASLATAYPYVAGVKDQFVASNNAVTLGLDHLNVQNNDMVVVVFSGSIVWTPPAGYATKISALGAQTFTHLWLTGDTLAPVFSGGTTGYFGFAVYLVRSMGTSASVSTVYIDSVTGNAVTGTSPVVGATTSVTPAGASELLVCFFGRANSSGTDTWSSISGGLTQDVTATPGSALLMVTSHVLPAASPTGVFNATDTGPGGTYTIEGVAALFNLTGGGGGATARHRLLFK